MSLADIKRRAARQVPMRGQTATPVATPAPAPEIDMRRRQKIVITADGPESHWCPGFMFPDRPILGSPEAARALEEAWAKWRLKQGEAVDRG